VFCKTPEQSYFN